MTTISEAAIGSMALERLKLDKPEAWERIAKITGKSIGSERLAKVHFKNGGFIQLNFARKGTHTAQCVDQLLALLKSI